MTPGLTPFLCAMVKADPVRLAAANVAKLAERYAIPEQTARDYFRFWSGR